MNGVVPSVEGSPRSSPLAIMRGCDGWPILAEARRHTWMQSCPQSMAPENDGSVERKPWLRTVPVNEVSDGAMVRSLAAFGRKGVQDCCFGLL